MLTGRVAQIRDALRVLHFSWQCPRLLVIQEAGRCVAIISRGGVSWCRQRCGGVLLVVEPNDGASHRRQQGKHHLLWQYIGGLSLR
jgi:hypothetical protein